MSDSLIELDEMHNSSELNQTIWDIENAEKLQFASFIEDKIENKYLKKFDYFEQLLLSMQSEYNHKILKLSHELTLANEKANHSLGEKEDYILIGWFDSYSHPIIVPKNACWSGYGDNINWPGLAETFMREANRAPVLYIMLPQLYKLPNIRNLDLCSELLGKNANTRLIDQHCNVLLNGIGCVTHDISINKNKYCEHFKEQIVFIEQTYPGLLKNVFI